MPSLADSILEFCSESPEARQYAETHLGRFVKTVEITPKGAAGDRLLEMGAYMQITPSLAKLGYGEVRGCYLGPLGKGHTKTVTSTRGESFSCSVDFFNAESDPFPYEDGYFATVVCCELVEHLAEDPMHMMSEVNRILRPGGAVVMSTPNICSLRAIAGVLTGYHPGIFSKYTARQGGNQLEPRHAREYAPRDVGLLLEAAGFSVAHLDTTPQPRVRPTEWDWVKTILTMHRLSSDLREDVIHAVGKKVGPVKDRYPEWLYT